MVGVQVKSSAESMTFDFDKTLPKICKQLHFTPVLAHVFVGKFRDVQFCMKKQGIFHHILADGVSSHPLGQNLDCEVFSQKIGIKI